MGCWKPIWMLKKLSPSHDPKCHVIIKCLWKSTVYSMTERLSDRCFNSSINHHFHSFYMTEERSSEWDHWCKIPHCISFTCRGQSAESRTHRPHWRADVLHHRPTSGADGGALYSCLAADMSDDTVDAVDQNCTLFPLEQMSHVWLGQ